MKAAVLSTMRIVLALLYLWVVADRLGWLGPAGNPGVLWGNFATFLDYTAALNPWAPRAVSDTLGYFVTGVEGALAVLLVSGVRKKEASLGSLLLLLVLIASLVLFVGPREGLGFIAFTALFAVVSWVLYREARRRPQ